jgi:hypothetical protein
MQYCGVTERPNYRYTATPSSIISGKKKTKQAKPTYKHSNKVTLQLPWDHMMVTQNTEPTIATIVAGAVTATMPYCSLTEIL